MLPLLIAHHARNGVHALNVLTAALRADPRTAPMTIRFAKDAAEISAILGESTGEVLVAWSFYSPESHEMAEALRTVKAAPTRAHVTHVAGGVHATAEPQRTLDDGFDLAALGEGEKTLVELVLAIAEGRDPLSVRGLAARGRTSGRGETIALDD
ncbi:MAG: cobalamin-dependent protein, partial [Polyangiales bacterium]